MDSDEGTREADPAPESLKDQQEVWKAAGVAFQHNDLQEATRLCRSFWGAKDSFIFEDELDLNTPPSGLTVSQIPLPSGDSGTRVAFEEAMVFLGNGLSLPIGLDGRTFTKPFAVHHYPTNYITLYEPDASAALKALSQENHAIDGAQTISHLPVYFHYILDTLPYILSMNDQNGKNAPLLVHESTLKSEWQFQVLNHSLKRFGLEDIQFAPSAASVVKVKNLQTMVKIGTRSRLKILRSLSNPRADQSRASFLYVQRAPTNRRQLRNEEAVLEALGPKFTVIRPDQLDFETQIGLFSKADCIVGVHGSNLTNIVFAPEGCGVVELYGGLAQQMYENISHISGMPYTRVAGTLCSRSQDREHDFHHDFTVDPKAVVAGVEEVMS